MPYQIDTSLWTLDHADDMSQLEGDEITNSDICELVAQIHQNESLMQGCDTYEDDHVKIVFYDDLICGFEIVRKLNRNPVFMCLSNDVIRYHDEIRYIVPHMRNIANT